LSIQTISILVLIVVFAMATVLPLNMGALALAATFFIGVLGLGLSTKEIFAGFPGDLFVTLVGVTYLFAIAQKNGTVDWLVERAVLLVGGRVIAIPWVMFVTAALLTAFGALGPAAVAILAPVALTFAIRHRVHPVMMGLMVIHGAQAGGFSPISVYGGIVNGLVAKAGMPSGSTEIFAASFFFNLAIAVAVFVVFGGLRLGLRRDGATPSPDAHPEPASRSILGHGGTPATETITHPANAEPGRRTPLNGHRAITLAGLAALGVGAIVFEFNVGLLAMVVAVGLALLAPKEQKGAIDRVSWSTVLLICGVITYVEVMQKAGTVDQVGHAISSLGSPLLAALLLCFTGAIVSAFASSTALLGAVIPLAIPFLAQGRISAIGVIAAISVCTTIVDTSPFSTNGALVVANAPEDQREKVLRILLIYSAIVVAIGPILAWLVLVLPNWL
jgi:di/tricarboxylate transporter